MTALTPTAVLAMGSLGPFGVALSIALIGGNLFLFSNRAIVAALTCLVRSAIGLLLYDLLTLFNFVYALRVYNVNVVATVVVITNVILVTNVVRALLNLLISAPGRVAWLVREVNDEEIVVTSARLLAPMASRRRARCRASRVNGVYRAVTANDRNERRLSNYVSGRRVLHLSECERQRSRCSLVEVGRSRYGRSNVSNAQYACNYPRIRVVTRDRANTLAACCGLVNERVLSSVNGVLDYFLGRTNACTTNCMVGGRLLQSPSSLCSASRRPGNRRVRRGVLRAAVRRRVHGRLVGVGVKDRRRVGSRSVVRGVPVDSILSRSRTNRGNRRVRCRRVLYGC